jgi:hypothetical protein
MVLTTHIPSLEFKITAGVDLPLELAPRASAAHFWDTAVLRMNTVMLHLMQSTREYEDVSQIMELAKTLQLDVV